MQEGQIAPNFTLQNHQNQPVSLYDFKGQYVILYFYPKDNTPGCTKQACQFRDDFQSYQKNQISILGISTDNVQSHQKFAQKYQLPFVLLADTDKTVSNLYQVFKQKSMFGKTFLGIERTTFIIDPQSLVQKIFKKVNVKDHSQKILQILNLN